HLPLERPGLGRDDGVVGEQREEVGVAHGARREDLGDAVEPLELLGLVRLAALALLDLRPLLAQQERGGLELRTRGGRGPAPPQRRLDLPDGAGEHRAHVLWDARSAPAGTAVAGRCWAAGP